MKRFLPVVLILLAFAGGLNAQDSGIEYQRQVGALSTLYRGRLPDQYSYKYNGTYYWDHLGFRKGDLFYDGKLYRDILLNIDACRMDLQVRTSMDLTPVVPDPAQVDWFTMDGRFFLNLNNLGYKKAPAGYFELIKDGPSPVLKQVRKFLRTNTSNCNGDIIGYYQQDYNPEIVNCFAHIEHYYTLHGEEVKKMNKNAYRKAVKESRNGTPFLETLARTWKGNTGDAPLPEIKHSSSLSLPQDYFSENPNIPTYLPEQEGTKATYRNKIYILGNGDGPGPFTIQGQVRDMESGSPFPEAVVFDEKTSTYTRADQNGYYSITLPAGENTIHYSDPSKEEISLNIQLKGNASFDVDLPEKVTLLKASVVSATSMENHRRTTMGVQSVSINTLNKIPTAFGEADVLKGVFTLPGVKSAGESSAGFTVRGGSQDENLILFNGNTIYNPTHLFGLFSTFNPDVVEEVELLKSSIPAKYGGRISSVLDVQSREGSMEKYKGSLGIGLLTGHLHFEGPIVKNKTSFLLAGRTTYSDWLLGLLPKDSHYSGGSAGFKILPVKADDGSLQERFGHTPLTPIGRACSLPPGNIALFT